MIILFLFLPLSVFSEPSGIIDYPNIRIEYDSKFLVQKFFEARHCFLAEYRFDKRLASEIVEKHCRRFNLNQRIILCRMHVEYNLFSGRRMGDYWIYPYKHKPLKIKYLLNQICGYGLVTRIHGRKYVGFENQVYYCAKFYRQRWDEFGHMPFVVFKYDNIKASVGKFFATWEWLKFPTE